MRVGETHVLAEAAVGDAASESRTFWRTSSAPTFITAEAATEAVGEA